MSILIKGMKMPKSCNNCNFQCFTEWGGDSPYANEIATKCLATDKFVFPSDSERDENCPLIEVPIVHCCECKYNNHCLTQSFIEEESRVPFDRNTYFCSDGVKEE